MARALSKAGGLARQGAQRLSPAKATAKGRPQQRHPCPSRKLMPLQQAGQKPGWLTAVRQAMQSGGNNMSSTALAAFVAMNSRSCDMLSLTKMSDLPNTGRPPLFDFSACRNARARAKRLTILCERVDAREALALGFVDYVTKQGGALDEARRIAARVLEMPQGSVRMSKETINATAYALAHLASHAGADQFNLAAQGAEAAAARARFRGS